METKEAIYERRSIRDFKKEEISKNVIEDILNCGRLAPSAKNRQPWYFVIVSGKIKNQIADMMIEYTLSEDEKIRNQKLVCRSSVNPTARAIKEAPVLILIFKAKNDNMVIGDNLSIGACVENMCLRATDLGLGSLWIRDVARVGIPVSQLLKHDDLELNCALALGYANQIPNMRPRKKLEEIVEWYCE